jgi:hypothetical protein
MKKTILFITAITSLIFTSCVRSLYPVTENENDLVFKKEFLGRWKDSDSAQYIVDTIKGRNGKIYRVTIVDSKKATDSRGFSDTSYFMACLANINNRFFLDCTVDMDAFANKNIGESAAGGILQTHFIIPVISIQQNLIEVTPIDEEKLLTLLTQKKFNLRSELIDKDNLLITEKPLALQQKLLELERFPFVFSKTTLFRAKN